MSVMGKNKTSCCTCTIFSSIFACPLEFCLSFPALFRVLFYYFMCFWWSKTSTLIGVISCNLRKASASLQLYFLCLFNLYAWDLEYWYPFFDFEMWILLHAPFISFFDSIYNLMSCFAFKLIEASFSFLSSFSIFNLIAFSISSSSSIFLFFEVYLNSQLYLSDSHLLRSLYTALPPEHLRNCDNSLYSFCWRRPVVSAIRSPTFTLISYFCLIF